MEAAVRRRESAGPEAAPADRASESASSNAELQLAAAEEPFAWEDMGLDLELERERQERNDYE